MKKLSLIISISTILLAHSIIPAESPNVMKTMAARLAALKKYFFEKEKAPMQPTTIAPKPSIETSTTIPIIFYHPASPWEPAYITLINAKNSNEKININKSPKKQLNSIYSYNLSPKKQYLLLEKIPTKEPKSNITYNTKLINALTQEEILSFNHRAIMYTFSPDETTMIIATVQQPRFGFFNRGPDPKGASQLKLKNRERYSTNRILRYDFFDIATKTILKTFENIKLITYLADNKLFIEYDDGTMENITLEKKEPSFFDTIMNLFNRKSPIAIQTTSTITSNFKIETDYDADREILSLKSKEEIKKQYESRSFHLSPKNKYIVIEQFKKTSLLIELQNGKTIATFTDLITYEFNENEDKLLVLCKKSIDPNVPTNSSEYRYQLYDMTIENIEPITFDKNIQSAYFTSPEELITIDKQGNRTTYDEKLEEIEDIKFYLESFSDSKNKNEIIISLIELLARDDENDRKEFIENYNTYDLDKKKEFASFFFDTPTSNVQSKTLNINTPIIGLKYIKTKQNLYLFYLKPSYEIEYKKIIPSE